MDDILLCSLLTFSVHSALWQGQHEHVWRLEGEEEQLSMIDQWSSARRKPAAGHAGTLCLVVSLVNSSCSSCISMCIRMIYHFSSTSINFMIHSKSDDLSLSIYMHASMNSQSLLFNKVVTVPCM